MRGDARYASSKLAAFGPILSALSHFFERGSWTHPVHTLGKWDRIYVLNQAALHLSITKGFPAPEAKVTYELARHEAEAAESVSDLFLALRGLWRCHHVAAEYEEAWVAANSLVEWSVKTGQVLHVAEANFALGATAFYLGKFVAAREHLERAIAAYGPEEPHSGMGGFDVRVASLSYAAWALWYLGYPDRASERRDEAVGRARVLLDHHTLALALHFSANLAQCCGDGEAVRRYAGELTELSSKYGFVHWLACGTVMQGFGLVLQEMFADGIDRTREGLEGWKSANAKLGLSSFVGRLGYAHAKAYERTDESDRSGLLAEALGLVEEGLNISASHNERYFAPELYRIKGEIVILIALQGAAEEEAASLDVAEGLFRSAIELACSQESKSLQLRAVTSLSRLLISRRREAEAREMLVQVYSRFEEGHQTADYVCATNLLKRMSRDNPEPTSLHSSFKDEQPNESYRR